MNKQDSNCCREGMMQGVYGTHPYQTEIEVLDLGCEDPDIQQCLQERLKTVKQELQKFIKGELHYVCE